MSERQRKEFPWVSMTPSTLVALRKSLLPAHGLCPPWELRTRGHSCVTLGPPLSREPASPLPYPPPCHSCVPLSTCSPGESLAKWGVNQAMSQFGGPELTPQQGLRGEGRDPRWETKGLALSPQPLAKTLYRSGPQCPHL